jgi:hypothetical protein
MGNANSEWLPILCDNDISLDDKIYVKQSFFSFQQNAVIIVKYKSYMNTERSQAYIEMNGEWYAFDGIKYEIKDKKIKYLIDILPETIETKIINYYLAGGLYDPITNEKKERTGFKFETSEDVSSLEINKFIGDNISVNYPENKKIYAFDFTYAHKSGYFFTPFFNLINHNYDWYKNNVYPSIRDSSYFND